MAPNLSATIPPSSSVLTGVTDDMDFLSSGRPLSLNEPLNEKLQEANEIVFSFVHL